MGQLVVGSTDLSVQFRSLYDNGCLVFFVTIVLRDEVCIAVIPDFGPTAQRAEGSYKFTCVCMSVRL